MELVEINLYRKDLSTVTELDLPWENLKNKTVLITGATGLIGTFLIDCLMKKNSEDNLNCKVLAVGRTLKKAELRFSSYWENENFSFIKSDISKEIIKCNEKVNYLIHAASNTHPRAYSTDPIGTITTNVIGTNNLLKFSAEKKVDRFLFASSVEVYGENKGDTRLFNEKYLGYIDCNTLRAGYPESKRVGESLCQAYLKQMGQDFVITRLARTYGPTMLKSDSKAISQFIKNGVNNENVVLKSSGEQLYSYCYVADAVRGILYCLLKGTSGEAYNIANLKSNITLKELAENIAKINNKSVVYNLPDSVELQGFSKATKALLDESKLRKIGYTPIFDIKLGLKHTIEILKERRRINGE
ncbi:NAD-dependent epimerase/dehydratase family protein [Liquorilactobacillus nagelii]|uniref:NAD-dependent epimerase/dehydratase family protein n=1 Tax=Liquorilactobacillus nagelii TaxID=82688 RepID=UPI0006F0788A|nr:NAD-dependent epimerase/dehydratase family protein [Liquorilactobacillus nagelii]KRL41531.1 epimerase dehydratase [Liquorilactobacillus nagelii DSM 13675]QYH54139.1 NAD-dependent epimerase/dehydratase family protein [Liquorilactobacillus nagelii DSM 13675]